MQQRRWKSWEEREAERLARDEARGSELLNTRSPRHRGGRPASWWRWEDAVVARLDARREIGS